MPNQFLGIALIFCLVIYSSLATRVTDCDTGDEFKDFDQVQMSDCIEPPCLLKSKSMVNIHFKFVPGADTAVAKTKVTGTMPSMPQPVPFPGIDGSDACKIIAGADGMASQCPLKAGQEYFYNKTIKVESFYPKVPVTVTWGIFDADNKPIICFVIPSKIVA